MTDVLAFITVFGMLNVFVYIPAFMTAHLLKENN